MARPATRERLSRILSMVPWIAAQDSPSIREVCDRFGITAKQLRADLNTVLLFNVYPHYPDDYVTVFLDEDDDGYVTVDYTNFVQRPLRLTRDEALAVLVAGAASVAAPGQAGGPLERAMTKLGASFGIRPGDDLAVVLPAEGAIAATLDAAVRERRVVDISYYSPNRNETSERAIEPRRLHLADGYVYVDAFCRVSDDTRLFRLDRISAAVATEETFEPGDEPAEDGAGHLGFARDEDVPRVTLEVPADAEWVVETYPTDAAEQTPDGRWRVTLAVAALPWLERLWLRLGPEVEWIDGPEEWANAGPAAAARMVAATRGGPATH